MIDPRVHYVGASYLRKLKLRQLGDEVYVIQCPEPVQVLLSYEHFLRIQEQIAEMEKVVAEGTAAGKQVEGATE